MKTAKRAVALLLAILLLASVSLFPALAESADKPLYTYIGDSMSFDFVDRFGYLDPMNIYPRQIADTFGYDLYEYCALPYERSTDAYALLSEDYEGDEYTQQYFAADLKGSRKAEFTQNVSDASVISVQIGYNALTMYFVTDILDYFSQGELPYTSSFAQIFTEKERAAILPFASKCADLIEALIGEKTEAALAQYLDQLSVAQKEALVSLLGEETAAILADGKAAVTGLLNAMVYTVAGHLIHFDRLIARINELNPDAEIYVMGLVNPLDDLKVGFRLGGSEYGIDIGSVLNIVYELINSYVRVFSPYSADYYYVENCDSLETFGDLMTTDEEMCRRYLYNIHNGSRSSYGNTESEAYKRADAEVSGVMQALRNTACIELDKLLGSIPAELPDMGSLIVMRPTGIVREMEQLDENGVLTAPYFDQLMMRVAFFKALHSMFVHPTQNAHDAEAQLLITAMQKKQVDPLAKAYHRLMLPLESTKKLLDNCTSIDGILAQVERLSASSPTAEKTAAPSPILPLLSTVGTVVKTVTTGVWSVVGNISHSILRFAR